MLKKIATIFVSVLLLSAFLYAQDHSILRPNGKIIKYRGDLKNLEIRPNKLYKNSVHNSVTKNVYSNPGNILDKVDTLGFSGPWASNQFVFYSQDVMLQWFVCPADLTILQVGFSNYANDPGGQEEVKLVKVNWSADDLLDAPIALHGYYEATANGWNDATAFMDNPDITGGWVSLDGGLPEPFGEDLWSEGGVGLTLTPTTDTDPTTYNWVDLSLIGTVDLNRGDIFGVVVKNTNVEHGDADGPTFEYNDFNIGGWKFYAEGRNSATDFGWWSREYSWNFVAEVNLTGDRPPVINSYDQVPSGLDQGPFTVNANITDDNPGDEANAGVASAVLHWSNNGGTTWNDVAMTGTEPDFSGEIPAQSPNTYVTYYIEATDVNSLSSQSISYQFYVFGPTSTNLVVFNGWGAVSGYPPSYYFGYGDFAGYDVLQWDHDSWSYGALTADLVNNYTNIIEICTNGPLDINNDVIKAWLDADASHNYMLMGDEYLGSITGWTDSTYQAGDFQYDVLGISADHNDINYAASGDQTLPSVVKPVEGSLLCGDLFTLYTDVTTTNSWTAPMQVDPYYEVSVSNWLDGVDFLGDVEVDMTGVAADGTTEYSIGGHRTLSAGNKVAFFTFDGLSLDSDTENEVEYYWYGFTAAAPQVAVLEWFGITTGVERKTDDQIPNTFKLSQNYPNPFNPNTTINFSVPKQSNVLIKVYDVLGKEVATLVNGEKAAGNYSVDFDASKLTSGMYIYTIQAGNYTATKKMMLLK
jgi:hypothetical protein